MFRSVSGTVPQYEFRGGTKCYSQMSSLNVQEKLEYVQDCADVTLSNCKNSGKNLKRAQEFLLKANKSKDIERMKNLNIALTSPINEEESYKIEFVKCYLTFAIRNLC